MLDNRSYAVLCLACILSGITEKHARRIVGKRFASSVLENLSKNGYIMLTNQDDLFADEVYRIGNAIKASGNSGQRSNISDFEVEAIRSYIHQQFSRSLPTE